MKDNKERLGVVDFGRQLITTGDLDPLYIALHHSTYPPEIMARWLVAYWCYYHAGLCCEIVGAPSFYNAMRTVAKGGTDYPRGTERRHFRAKLAIDSIESMSDEFSSPSELLNWLTRESTANGLRKRVMQLRGFGNWISWKVPDMIERLGIAPVSFVKSDLHWMFKSSTDGAVLTYDTYSNRSPDVSTRIKVEWAHGYLKRKLGTLKAPPLYERRINVQETETVFCKWKSHLGGHYPMGKDTTEIIEGLEEYLPNKFAAKLLKPLRQLREGNLLCP